jgi:hypothetical protein
MTTSTNFVSMPVTDDIEHVVDVYERATGTQAVGYTADFADLIMPSCTRAIASDRTMTVFGNTVAPSVPRERDVTPGAGRGRLGGRCHRFGGIRRFDDEWL